MWHEVSKARTCTWHDVGPPKDPKCAQRSTCLPFVSCKHGVPPTRPHPLTKCGAVPPAHLLPLCAKCGTLSTPLEHLAQSVACCLLRRATRGKLPFHFAQTEACHPPCSITPCGLGLPDHATPLHSCHPLHCPLHCPPLKF